MKLTRERLKQIIYEELEEINIYRDDKGHFSSKKAGNIRSLSAPAAKRNNVDSKYVGKGVVASSDPDKVRVKYNLPDCGRTITSTGADRVPKQSCKDYPEPYYKKKNEDIIIDEDEMLEGEDEQQRAYLKGTVDQAVKKSISTQAKVQPCDLNAILSALDSFSKAEKGKYRNGGSS